MLPILLLVWSFSRGVFSHILINSPLVLHVVPCSLSRLVLCVFVQGG
jgi:hypothetical protein